MGIEFECDVEVFLGGVHVGEGDVNFSIESNVGFRPTQEPVFYLRVDVLPYGNVTKFLDKTGDLDTVPLGLDAFAWKAAAHVLKAGGDRSIVLAHAIAAYIEALRHKEGQIARDRRTITRCQRCGIPIAQAEYGGCVTDEGHVFPEPKKGEG